MLDVVCTTCAQADRTVAAEIAALVRLRAREGRPCVLGLATGRTPLGVYRELIRLRREEQLSFVGVTTFNLDEYLGLAPADPRSFRAAMQRELFEVLDVPLRHIYFPRGDLSPEVIEAHCAEYERSIEAAGGIDLQVLGIGRNGHIGFNEPGSPPGSRTRLVRLAPQTREDAAGNFGGLERVPARAITMGVATILAARSLRALAFGPAKAPILRRILRGEEGEALPAGWLRRHPDCRLWTDFAD